MCSQFGLGRELEKKPSRTLTLMIRDHMKSQMRLKTQAFQNYVPYTPYKKASPSSAGILVSVFRGNIAEEESFRGNGEEESQTILSLSVCVFVCVLCVRRIHSLFVINASGMNKTMADFQCVHDVDAETKEKSKEKCMNFTCKLQWL